MQQWKTLNISNKSNNSNNITNKTHIIQCLMDGLNKLLNQLKELQHFAYINAEGFRKIIKKYDKRLETNTKNIYNPLFIECSFYQRKKLQNMIDNVTNIITDKQNTDKLNNQTVIYQLANEMKEIDTFIDFNTIDFNKGIDHILSSSNKVISQIFL